MLNLAPIRYSKAIASSGGPIARLEHSLVEIRGEPCVHAVAYLKDGIVDEEYLKRRASVQPDGAGCHESAQIACYMAISEAMERWAVYHCRREQASGLGGIDIDGSSNGFAAYPGLFRRQTRPAAYRESIERHCLICWWEGLLKHQCLEAPCPGVSALLIENPFSSHAVVVLWSETPGGASYAFGAGTNVPHAIQRALVELDRTQSLMRQLTASSGLRSARVGGDVFERRIAFFASDKGRELFLQCLGQQVVKGPSKLHLLFDSYVAGPWDSYSSVWRTIIEAPSSEYLSDREDYFFW